MKFLHTADLHLGKIVNGVSMLTDQIYILKQITTILKAEQVDGILIAGDLYDRAIPNTDAVEAFNHILYEWNVTLGLPIFAISGNHDSAERISFGAAWYKNSQFYLQGKVDAELKPIVFQETEIWLVPYHEPAFIREIYAEPAIRSFDDAMKAITERIYNKQDPTKKQILMGHAFVAGGLPSDSERQLSVGNIDRVSLDALAGFDYVALGHLHHPHALKHPSIHYSGSPLKYSFSEASDIKSVRIVEFDQNGLTNVREIALKPLRDMRIVTGTLSELTTEILENPDDYLQVNLTDRGGLVDPIGQLRQFYPNVLHLEREKRNLVEQTSEQFDEIIRKDDLELFEQFFSTVNGQSLTEKQQDIMTNILAKAAKESES